MSANLEDREVVSLLCELGESIHREVGMLPKVSRKSHEATIKLVEARRQLR